MCIQKANINKSLANQRTCIYRRQKYEHINFSSLCTFLLQEINYVKPNLRVHIAKSKGRTFGKFSWVFTVFFFFLRMDDKKGTLKPK